MDTLLPSVDLYGDDLHYHIEKDADVNFNRLIHDVRSAHLV